MGGSTFGTIFRVTTAGESHGPANVAIVDGVPAGLELSVDDLLPDLARRRPGQSRLTTQRKEEDAPRILSGVHDGRTTGTPIAILIENRDQRSRDYGDILEKVRPGHADFTYDLKYGGHRDPRGGGRASARETVARVAAGAIARKLLATTHGVAILGWVDQVGDVRARVPDPLAVTRDDVEATPVRCPDRDAAELMIDLIERVRADRDSIGGAATVVASGVPPGWGEPVFDKLDADLARAMMSIPAVKGVEIGAGFAVAAMRGTQNNDPFVPTPAGPRTRTNHHGGILGGISSGMPILVRCAVKPTSSLPRDQDTVTRTGQPTTISTHGRHDPCLLPRFVPIAEAMLALVLADHMLRQRSAVLRSVAPPGLER